MGASVRIEDDAFSDLRYDELADLLGLPDADCARGKMAKVWRQCTIENRHSLPKPTIKKLLGERGVDALLGSRLGEDLGDEIRVKGTSGRIEWLKKLRKNGKYGKLGGRPKKNPDGFLENPDGFPNKTPPAPAPAPAPAPSRVVAPTTPPGLQKLAGDSVERSITTEQIASGAEQLFPGDVAMLKYKLDKVGPPFSPLEVKLAVEKRAKRRRCNGSLFADFIGDARDQIDRAAERPNKPPVKAQPGRAAFWDNDFTGKEKGKAS